MPTQPIARPAETPSASGKLLTHRDGPVTTLTLNRPGCHNALDMELSAELNEAIREAGGDRECRVLILRGAGETFCAGDDIKGFRTWGEDEPYWQVRLYQQTAQLIEDLTPVTIAAVDGVCTGGGLELTLVCDFVIATDRSRWGMPEIDWDITPGWGGLSRLPRFAGRRKAKEWNLIGNLFTAQTAERYDLVNRICSHEQLDSEVAALVEVMLAKHPITLRRSKTYLDKGADLHISGALAFEALREPSQRPPGIDDFADREARARRRVLSQDFWSQ
jgi:enoyl-CoA hydratase